MAQQFTDDPETKNLKIRNPITDCSAQILMRGKGA